MQNDIFSNNPNKSKVETEADRNAYVRDWIARRLKAGKTVSAGFLGAVLTLPALAVAQVREGFVSASDIQGVQNVEMMADGTAQMQMANGTTIAVPAQDIQIAANGQVMVSARVAEIAAEVMAAGAGGAGLGAGAIVGAGAAAAATAAIASDGGGSGGGGAETPTINAAVLSANGGLSNENTGLELPEGTSSIEVTVTDSEGGETTTTVTPDADGNWVLPEPDGGFPEGNVTVNVTSFDEDGEETGSDDQELLIDTVPPAIAISDTGVGEDGVLNIAEMNEGITISGTTDAEDGQEVTVTISKESGEEHVKTAVVSGGEWSVDVSADDLTGGNPPGAGGYDFDGQSIEVEAEVEDASGNPAQTTDSFTTDLSGPEITIDTISDDDQVGLLDVNDADGLTVTGTTSASVGQAVTLTFNGEDFAGEVVSNGLPGGLYTWEVTVPQSALQALQDSAGEDEVVEGVEVSATVDDAAGNPAPTPATTTIDADFSGPSIAIGTIAGDDVINSDESGADVTISGVTNNVGAGQTVSVTVNGSALADVQTEADGSWEATLPQADAAALPEGSAIEVTAAVSDADGIPANASSEITADFTLPTVGIDTISDDDIINIADSEQALTISGTSTDAEQGQMVEIGLPGLTAQMAEVGADGTWSVELTAEQTQQLVDGQDGTSLDITANLSDAAGNPAAEATRSVDVDTTAPSIMITEPIDADGTINIAESGSDLTVNGTADGTDSVTVTVNGTQVATATVTGSDWSVDIPSATLQAVTDGETIQITAAGEDAAGNTGSDEASLETDYSAPTVAIASVSTGDTLTLDELSGGMIISGTASEETSGSDVTVTLDGTDFTAPVQEDGTWTLTLDDSDITALNLADETDFDLSATVTDGAGNTSMPATFTISTDFRPIVAIDPIGVDGAVDLSDLGTPEITGTALGVEAGRDVTIVGTDPDGEILNATAQVQADGTWALTVPQATLDELDAGETVNVTANASNAAGRAAAEASTEVEAYLPSVFSAYSAVEDGSTLSVSVVANEGLVATDGVQSTMTFDPASANFVSGSQSNELDLFIVNDTDAGSGSVIFSGGTLTEARNEGDLLYEFDVTDQGAGPITLNFEDDNQGGQTELQIGTSGADTLTSGSIDSILQGRGGDDALDVSASGRNVVVFNADQATNGTDTVTGFTTGTTFQSDVMAITGTVDMRGDGDALQTLAEGGALNADTGFVIFTTALDDTEASTLETAFEGLTGEAEGDTVFFLAGDGEDAALVRTETNGADDASVEVMARFEGIGDLSDLSPDNVILPDPVMNT
ncbi:Ig-like domain-containing protein [Roseovarius sp. MMSF_3281]|uniref:Ig-like domain-containing protein n=1 Tax=Roseovarius sp. MMSF_3281 TaxID=3046694 RepID=UPI00273E4FC3|nr:Ig-like domain-containing protein [Roseovarius sp. MMSF_3281]